MKIRENPIFVLRPYGDDQEILAVKEVIESGWWGKGPKVTEFEQDYFNFTSCISSLSTKLSQFNVIHRQALLLIK